MNEHPFNVYLSLKEGAFEEAAYYTSLCKYTIPDKNISICENHYKVLLIKNILKNKLSMMHDKNERLDVIILWNVDNLNSNGFHTLKSLISLSKKSARSKLNMVNFKLFPNVNISIKSSDLLKLSGKNSIVMFAKIRFGNIMKYMKSIYNDTVFIFITDKFKFDEYSFINKMSEINKEVISIYINNKINIVNLSTMKINSI